MSVHGGSAGHEPPAVSVVMPVHSGERHLADAIASVLAQTVDDLELIVVDDGSTDGTSEILDRFADIDTRVLVHRQENEGVAAARNRGVALACASLIAFIDADDVAVSDRLERQVRFLEEHPEIDVVGGAATLIDDTGRSLGDAPHPTTDAEIRLALGHTTPFIQSAVTLRREPFEAVGGYRAAFTFSQDLDLWLRLSERCRMANLSEVVVQYRFHPSQVSLRRMRSQALYTVAARRSAAARSRGAADPFDAVHHIDEQTLLADGATPREITAVFVESAVWLAKMADRAGYADTAARAFRDAEQAAESGDGSPRLLALVHRARATRNEERGRRWRSKVDRLRAVLAERRA